MVSALDRLSYAARQTARVAWYAGHYAAGRRLLKPMPKPDFAIGPTPSRAELTAEMRALFERSLNSPNPAYRTYQAAITREGCAAVAELHNSTTPAQRTKAAQVLKGYEDAFRELSASR